MGKRRSLEELLKLDEHERKRLRDEREEAEKEDKVVAIIALAVVIAGLVLVVAIFGALAEVASWTK